ncbi:hypothetical protein FRC12_005025 [Ceratobasidium sp. 428]|nr:hypothetical protein FRC12_005025 [Ceratobasidium sp. 428]
MPLTFVQQLELKQLQRACKSPTKSSDTSLFQSHIPPRTLPGALSVNVARLRINHSHTSSHSPSPLGPKSTKHTPKSTSKCPFKSSSKSSSKSTKSKEPKNLFGTRGDRPRQIVQPVVDAGAASHSSLPEPLAATKSDNRGFNVETQRDRFFHIIHISHAKAIDIPTRHTGKDALNYSMQTLQKVLEDVFLLRKVGLSGCHGN